MKWGGTRRLGANNGECAAARALAFSFHPGARGETANGGSGVAGGAAGSGRRGQASGAGAGLGLSGHGGVEEVRAAPSLPGLGEARAPAGGAELSWLCRNLCRRSSIGCGGPGWVLGPRLCGGYPPPPLPR